MFSRLPIVFLCCLTLHLASCSGSKPKTAEGQVIDLSGIWDNRVTAKLSDLVTDIEYIPLETKAEIMLKDATQIKASVYSNYIVVNSGGMRLFDRKGKFLRNLGGIGKGPGEFQSSSVFSLNEKSGKVYILDSQQKKIVVYRLSGEFIGSITIGKAASRIETDSLGNIGILYLPYREDLQDSARFEWLQEDGKVLETIPLYKGRERDGGEMWAITARLYRFQDHFIYGEWPFDTIYRLWEGEGWKPYLIPVLGKAAMPREVSLNLERWAAERSLYTKLILSYESERFILFDAQEKESFGLVWYDKSLSKGYWAPGIMSADSSKMDILVNDLDGGTNIYSSWYNSVRDEKLIHVISPFDLIARSQDYPDDAMVKRPDLRDKLIDLASRLKEDDNPIVMVMRLKSGNAK